MKKIGVVVLGLLLCSVFHGLAATALSDPAQIQNEAYIQLVQGDRSVDSGRLDEALAYYQAAYDYYTRLESDFPAWEPRIIEYRKSYSTTQLQEVKRQLGIYPEETQTILVNVVDTPSPVPAAAPEADYAVSGPREATGRAGRKAKPVPPTPEEIKNNEIASLTVELSKLMSENAQFQSIQTQLARQQQLNAQLEGELKSLAVQLDEARTQLGVRQDELTALLPLAEQTDTLRAENQRLQDELASAGQAAAAVQTQSAEEKQALAATVEQLEQQQAKTRQLEDALEQTGKQLADAQSQLQDQKKQQAALDALEKDRAQWQQRHQDLTGQLADSKRQMAEQKKAMEQAGKAELAELRQANKALDKQVAALTRGAEASAKTLAGQEQRLEEMAALRVELKTLQPLPQQLQEQQAQAAALQAELARARTDLQERGEDIRTLEAGRQTLMAQIEVLEGEGITAAELLQAKENELAAQQALAEGLEKERGNLQLELSDMANRLAEQESRFVQLAALQTERDALSVQNDELKKQLSAAESRMAAADETHQAALADMQQDKAGLLAQLNDLSAQLAAAGEENKVALAQVQEEKQTLAAQLNAAEDTLNVQGGQLEELAALRTAASGLAPLQDQLAAEQAAHAALQQQLEKEQAQLLAVQEELDTLRHTSTAQLQTLRDELADAASRLTASGEENKMALARAQEEKQALTAQAEELTAQLAGADATIQRQTGQLGELVALRTAVNGLRPLQEQLAVAQEAHAGLQQQWEEGQAQLQTAQEEKQALTARAEELTIQLTGAEATIQTQVEQLGELVALRTAVNGLRPLQEQLAGQEEQNQRLQAELAGLQTQLDEAAARQKELDGQQAELRGAWEVERVQWEARVAELQDTVDVVMAEKATGEQQAQTAWLEWSAQQQELEGRLKQQQLEMEKLESDLQAGRQQLVLAQAEVSIQQHTADLLTATEKEKQAALAENQRLQDEMQKQWTAFETERSQTSQNHLKEIARMEAARLTLENNLHQQKEALGEWEGKWREESKRTKTLQNDLKAVAKLEAALARVEAEKTTLTAKNKELTQENKDFAAAIKKQTREDKNTSAAMSKLTKTKEALDKQVEEQQQNLALLRTQLADAQAQTTALQAEVAASVQQTEALVKLQEEKEALLAANKQLQLEAKDLTARLKQKTDAAQEEWKAQLKAADKTNKALEKQLGVQRKEQADTVKTLQAREERLAALAQVEGELAALRKEQAEWNREERGADVLQQDLQAARQRTTELEQALKKAGRTEVALTTLQKEKDKLAGQLEQQQTAYHTLKGDEKTAQDELKAIRRQLAEKSGEEQNLRLELARSLQQLTALSALEKEAHALRTENARLGKENLSFDGRLAQLQETADKTAEQLKESRGQTRTLETELKQLRRQSASLSTLEEEAKTLRADNARLKKEAGSFDKQLAGLQKNVAQTEQQLETSRQETRALEMQLAQTREQLTDMLQQAQKTLVVQAVAAEVMEPAPAAAPAATATPKQADVQTPAVFKAILAARQKLQSGDSQAAVEITRRALMDKPDDMILRLIQGTALVRQGEYGEASTVLSDLAAAHPGNAEIQAVLGSALMGAKRYDEARTVLDRAVQLDADVGGETYYNLAMLNAFIAPVDLSVARTYYQHARRLGVPPADALENILK